MIKIAFIKFGGMANGGTEKYLQTIAAHLPTDEFDQRFNEDRRGGHGNS